MNVGHILQVVGFLVMAAGFGWQFYLLDQHKGVLKIYNSADHKVQKVLLYGEDGKLIGRWNFGPEWVEHDLR